MLYGYVKHGQHKDGMTVGCYVCSFRNEVNKASGGITRLDMAKMNYIRRTLRQVAVLHVKTKQTHGMSNWRSTRGL